jgi:hypothetical protein
MRRARRVDVAARPGGTEIQIDAMFRDIYIGADGVPTIVHEYTLLAIVERDTGRILESRATPRVLPWQECPGAAQSAARITGMTLPELHSPGAPGVAWHKYLHPPQRSAAQHRRRAVADRPATGRLTLRVLRRPPPQPRR